jgi:hypothetical protein
MAQIHLAPEAIARILRDEQTAVIYTIANDKYKVGGSISVREPWATEDGKTIYRADKMNWVGHEWHPSIHMRVEDVRLFLIPTAMKQVRFASITDDEVLALGYRHRDIMTRDWNLSLTKKKRPILGAKFNPLVWYIEFDKKVLDKQ